MSYVVGVLVLGGLFVAFGLLATTGWRGARCASCGSLEGPGGCDACSLDPGPAEAEQRRGPWAVRADAPDPRGITEEEGIS